MADGGQMKYSEAKDTPKPVVGSEIQYVIQGWKEGNPDAKGQETIDLVLRPRAVVDWPDPNVDPSEIDAREMDFVYHRFFQAGTKRTFEQIARLGGIDLEEEDLTREELCEAVKGVLITAVVRKVDDYGPKLSKLTPVEE